MAQTVIFPKLGQTMEEGAIVKWLKREGDRVDKGDILFEIETDKANLEVESFFEGTLIKILVREGVTVPVNTVVGFIGAPGEKAPDQVVAPPRAVAAQAASPFVVEPPGRKAETGDRKLAVTTPQPLPSAAPPAPARPILSPRARALAHEKAIDPSAVRGSGPNGRIVEKDLLAYLAGRNYHALRITPSAKRMAQEAGVDILTVRGSGDSGRIMVADVARAQRCRPQPMSRMRQVIARRLAESKRTIPHFYVTVTADLTGLTRYRADLKSRGRAYSVNDFILQAVVLALEEFPAVNSTTDGQNVSWRGDVDLGVAVSVENGLVVPVIRAAQLCTLTELRDRARALTEKARSGGLAPDEMTGGGFTVSNMGMLHVDAFGAIINPGEAGILAVASARQEPAVVDGEIRARTRMAMTLSADHRIVDGATGAAFLNAIRSKLENVELWKSLAE